MTIRELFDVCWTIDKVWVRARAEDLRLLHSFVIGEYKRWELGRNTIWRIESGEVSYIPLKVNAHGDPGKHGPEMGWGLKSKVIPDEILDAPVTEMDLTRYSGQEGKELHVSITLPVIQCEMMKEWASKYAEAGMEAINDGV